MGSDRHNAEQKRRLEEMFRAHHELVWRTLCRLGQTADAAADATQQAFLIAANRLDDIRPGCERAFVVNTAIRLSRSAHRRGRRCDLEDDMDVRADQASTRTDVAERCNSQHLLDQILSDVDPDLIATFVLFELEGLSMAEIAEALEIPAGTVASRLRRAREVFRARVARLDEAQRFDVNRKDVGTAGASRPPSPAPRRSWTALLPSILQRRSALGATK